MDLQGKNYTTNITFGPAVNIFYRGINHILHWFPNFRITKQKQKTYLWLQSIK